MTKECVHTQLHEAKVFVSMSDAIEQQSELIERWVEQEEKRLPPRPPKSPYE